MVKTPAPGVIVILAPADSDLYSRSVAPEFTVRTWCAVPIASFPSALELVARSISPVVQDDWPVPPFAATSVPDSVIVPDVVIGLPDTERPVVPPDSATLVTVPAPAAAQTGTPLESVRTNPSVVAARFARLVVVSA